MTSVLSSFFSRDPRGSFQYEIPSEPSYNFNGVSIGKSHKKSDLNEKATCLWSNVNDTSLKVQVQKLKTLRHPNILTYLDSLEVENHIYLITEPAQPLRFYMEECRLTAAQKELFVSWGLYQIMNGLKFLHSEVKITHNNMRDAICVTLAGDWKLSGFDQTRSFESPKTDLNGLVYVIWQVFNGFHKEVNLTSLESIPKRLHPLYKKMASKGQSFSVVDLLNESRAVGGFMKNKFVDTLLFLEEFQLKDSAEKHSFFVKLKDYLDMFPEDIAKYKILPKLIHTYEYGDAGSHILIPMFQLGRLLDEEEYQHRIVPCLVKLFGSPDRITRVKLLEKIDEFAPHLKPQIINEKIYANLVTGFTDTNPAVRESTVKAMAAFAEKLNYYNLNTDLMKHLARLQGADDQPGIRTNTTICLGKIGCYIDPSHRQRILISAFTRALKDSFPPARMAGVLALSATQQYYSLAEVANKILPALGPLTVDPEKQVRDQGFKALKGFLEKLEKASENPEIIPELEAQVKAGGRGGLLSSDKVPQWAGWALKAMSGKFYKSATPQPSENAAASNQENQPEPSHEKPIAKKPESEASRKESSAGLDGWGELDEAMENTSEISSWSKSVKETHGKKEDVGGWEQDEDDDWSTEWEKPVDVSHKTETKKTTTVPVKSNSKGTGSLKLSHVPKQNPADKELNDLLGEFSSSQRPATNTKSNDGWGDDFETTPFETEKNSSNWDDSGWGETESQTSKSSDKESRKAQIAARNEQRRKELAAKRAAKGIGAMKLSAKGD